MSAGRAASLTADLVGPHFGLVEELSPVRPEPDDVELAVYAARLANTAAFGPVEVPRLASGAGLTPAAAILACLGEAVERYAAGLPRPGSVRAAAARELGDAAVTPDRFALFDRLQYLRPGFPFRRWRPRDRLGWVEARSRTRDVARWAPAFQVHLPYAPVAGERLLAPSLSTGLACGASIEAASCAALCEVVERDAVALAWLGRVAPPRLSLDRRALAADTRALVDQFDAHDYRWAAFDLTTDLGVPVVAVLAEGRSPVGPIISFGSACRPDAEQALGKALVECVHGRMYVKSMIREEPDWRAGWRLRNVTSFAAHARFYATHPEHCGALDPWWNSARVVARPPAPERDFAALAADLAHRGFEVLTADLTTPDVRSLGLHVVRALVPGLQPLHGRHGWAHLGGLRLRRLAEVFGPDARAPRRWNPFPHPCP